MTPPDGNQVKVEVNQDPELRSRIEHRLTRLEVLIGVVIAQTLADWAGVGPDIAQAAVHFLK